MAELFTSADSAPTLQLAADGVPYCHVRLDSLRCVKDSHRYFSVCVPGQAPGGARTFHGIVFNSRAESLRFVNNVLQLSDMKSIPLPGTEPEFLERPCMWLTLSDELVFHVFRHLDLRDLVRVSEVCTRWRNIAHDGALWKCLYESAFFTSRRPANTWRDLYIQRYTYRKQRLRLSSFSFTHPHAKPLPQNPSRRVKSVKLVAVGDQINSEKTVLLMSYAHDAYPADYVPTVFDNYVVNIDAGEYLIELGLYDTSGAEEYDRLRPLSYSNANVILLIFSVVDPSSFEHIESKWHPEVHHFCPQVPILLVGTQIELRNDPETLVRLGNQGKVPISTPRAAEFAAQIKAKRYLECSSRTGENLKEVFDEAVRAVLELRPARNRCVVS